MALVKCPECGKEVSNSAAVCPNCGYGIKKYYDEKKEREYQQRKLNSIPMPNKPEKESSWIILSCIFGVIALIGFLAQDIMLGFVGLGLVVFFLYARESNYNSAMKKYELAQNNFKQYQMQEFERREKAKAEEAAKPRCPQCNSTNIEKISTVNRATSIAMTGLASGKIGKQYKCKNCKHMW